MRGGGSEEKELQVKAGDRVMTSVSKHRKDPPGTERLDLFDVAPGAKLGRMGVNLKKGSHKGDCDKSQGTSLDTRVPSMMWEAFSTEERTLGSRSCPCESPLGPLGPRQQGERG